MGIKYIYNPFSTVIEPVNETEQEEEFFTVDASLESNKMIPLAYVEKKKTERILVNGMELSSGIARDYIIMNGVINFNSGAILEGDSIKINYIRRY